ncbi:hypothetical protein WOLCODRAFT_101014 [Wolfiporia cocos MD-104 SS10]|uniref:Wax synthase domain-containing protein n=1 Tax=Wolfiporia cocos (strain MD-104) TaxID=742152 RepID=A0A2H3JIF6_WOLCO|nr:hypothetical protein WOLCODRAFT_101014 [Wolfiporia cocos MD-104 SS10]
MTGGKITALPERLTAWTMDSNKRPLLPTLPTVLLFNLFIGSIVALRPKLQIRMAAFVAYISSLAFIYSCTTGDMRRDYTAGSTLMQQFLTAFSLVWLTDPLLELRHERDSAHPLTLSFVQRLYWVQCIINNPRGVGWNYQVANVPPRLSVPRWRFVCQRCFSAFRWYLVLDVIETFILRSCVQNHTIYQHLVGPAQFGTLIATLAMTYDLLSALSVAAGIHEAHVWPEIYGLWSDAKTVRGFWGRTYHQTMRRHTATLGKRVCRVIGLQPGSWASSYTQLYIGFAVSGLVHCGGDLMVQPSAYGSSFKFFIAQAVAISLEDAVIALARRSGVRYSHMMSHFLGYIWVFTWLCISTPWLVRCLEKVGIIEIHRMPFSLITALIQSTSRAPAVFSRLFASMIPENVAC